MTKREKMPISLPPNKSINEFDKYVKENVNCSNQTYNRNFISTYKDKDYIIYEISFLIKFSSLFFL